LRIGDNRRVTITPKPVKPTVPFSVLDSLDVRVGQIRAAEDVPGSRKLARLTVDFGDHTRRILAGLRTERPSGRRLR
jgi:tRNA-binding protein